MAKTIRVYCKAENCPTKGDVWTTEPEYDEYEDDCDLQLWGEGTKDELIQQALDRLATRQDKRPGGAGDSYDWLCARNVLRYYDGPEVEYNDTARAYLPVVESEEEEAD